MMMESLSEELLMKVLAFVPPLDLLRNVRSTSKTLSRLIDSDMFWCNHPACPEDYRDLSMNLHQIQRYCLYQFQCEGSNKLGPSLRMQPLLPTRDEALSVAAGNFQASNRSTSGRILSRMIGGFRNNNNNGGFRNNNNNNNNNNSNNNNNNNNNNRNTQSTGNLLKCCAASTTHHYSEDITNVLFDPATDNDQMMEMVRPGDSTDGRDELNLAGPSQRWWSSSPSDSSETTDTIIFACRYPLAVLSKLRIQALRDPHRGHLSYTWKMSVVRAYRYPSSTIIPARIGPGEFAPFHFPAVQFTNDPSNHFLFHQTLQRRGVEGLGFPFVAQPFVAPPDKATIDSVLRGLTPVYESEPFTMPDSNRIANFDFPQGVIANLILVELIGKNHEQFQSQGYYACVERVGLFGIPLLSNTREEQHLLNM